MPDNGVKRVADTTATVLALCAGIGGLEIGLSLAADVRVVCYVERDAAAAATLLARMEEAALEPAPVWCGDLEDFDAALFEGVDIVTAGFPCQPWSLAGKRLGVDDDRWLWPDIAYVLRLVRPRIVFLENVPGLLVRGLGFVLGDLAEMGFDAEWSVLSAAEVGAPHRRERLYVLAHSARAKRPERELSGRDLPPEFEAVAGSGLPLFPPGRDEKWSDIHHALWPAVEPGLCRMVDGAPSRVDRLRMLGNAVVPLQAAHAFRSLWERVRPAGSAAGKPRIVTHAPR